MLCSVLGKGLDLSLVGAKAANLGKAIEYGFKVPPGFTVTRQALAVLLDETGLLKPVQALLNQAEESSYQERTKTYEAIGDRLSAVSIPPSLIEVFEPLAEALFAEAPYGLAVRSSGIYEDSAVANFAGVYESFLGIRTMEELWAAMRQCWCAAWSPSALDYARKMGVDPEPDAMGVLVQRLIPAQSAGMLFSADPQTGNPWRFVLESGFGLAQELVGGTGTTPADRFVVEWDSGRIISKEIADKSKMYVADDAGLMAIELSDQERSTASLSDTMVTRVAQQGLAIDRAFACRVDIEWVVADDEIYIVQVRPITALPDFFHIICRHIKKKKHGGNPNTGNSPLLTHMLTSPLPFTKICRLMKY
jgi:phosphoenolpyruvate synthase/pyruvate phosphate dikinase